MGVACLVLADDVCAAVQSLPFVDHFAYSDGNSFSVASGVWDAGGGAGPEFTVTNGGALTSPSGFAAVSGKGVKWQPSGMARRNIVQFSSQASGEIYVSFLLNNVTPPGSSRLIAYLENVAGSTVSSPQLGVFLNGSTLGIGKKTNAPSVTTTTNSDHTIDVMVPGTNAVFTPPYSYPLETALDVPGIVTNNAGAAKGPFAP